MKRTHWAAVFLLLTALGWVSAQSADKKRKNAPKATSKTEKSAKTADRRERSDRPPFEVTTLTGTLSFSGESDQTATVTDADGKTTALSLWEKREPPQTADGKDAKSGGAKPKAKKAAPNKNARPPKPNGATAKKSRGTEPPAPSAKKAEGKTPARRASPPKPITLDDLKKLDGKSVVVKGITAKNGALLVFSAAEK